jgi:hypothetical protein
MSGDADTAAGPVVGPTVIGASEQPIFDRPEGKASTAVNTEILPDDGLTPGPPQHQIETEETSWERTLIGDVIAAGNDMPVVDEDRVG